MIEVVLHISGEKMDIFINGADTFVIYLEKNMVLDPYLTLYAKINSKCIKT